MHRLLPLALCLLVGCGRTLPTQEAPADKSVRPKEETNRFTADELRLRYKADPAKTKRELAGKTVTVHGRIMAKGERHDENGKLVCWFYLSADSADEITDQHEIDEFKKNLKAGDQISFVARGDKLIRIAKGKRRGGGDPGKIANIEGDKITIEYRFSSGGNAETTTYTLTNDAKFDQGPNEIRVLFRSTDTQPLSAGFLLSHLRKQIGESVTVTGLLEFVEGKDGEDLTINFAEYARGGYWGVWEKGSSKDAETKLDTPRRH